MNGLWDRIAGFYSGYVNYLWREITFQVAPWWKNYFYWLLLVSVIFFVLELIKPWRQNQPKFRKDFWLDIFYMYFNFFIFFLIIFGALSLLISDGLNRFILYLFDFDIAKSNPLHQLPFWAIILSSFIISDFMQWNIHRMLHRVPWLWNFHKVHHSVQEMGFAAHLRYHWMENVVYKSVQYIPLTLLFGINLHDFFLIHIFGLVVGHYNHSNINISEPIKGLVFGTAIGAFVVFAALGLSGFYVVLGLLIAAGLGLALHPFVKYIFNSPEMHLWHHAYDLPRDKPYGVNYGLTLSIWDYIFKTNHIPHDKGDIRLGFPEMEDFPDDFIGQQVYGILPKK